MITIRSYSFNKQINNDILLLFTELLNGDVKCDCCYEIIKNALEGRIDLNGRFNLKSYESSINKNISLSNNKRTKTEISLQESISSDDSDDSTIEDRLQSSSSLQELDSVEEKLDYEWSLGYLKENYVLFMIYDDVDFVYCLRSYLKGNSRYIECIKKLCNKYKLFRESLSILLEYGLTDEVLNYIGGS